ncbi:MAG: 50S ribosomal protein L5 [Planctomycetota bacterium]|nr:50S ribosomal protein L5 [Planctomycetota bacterium]
MPRLHQKYANEVVPAVMQKFSMKNKLQVPRLEKVVLSMGLGKATENKNLVEIAMKDLAIIAGQKPVVCRARKSVAGFKVRIGDQIGCKVTLRRRRMYEFLDRLIAIVIPRIRDFRGLSATAFDGRGNYQMGIAEQATFPEISIDKVEAVQGLNVSVTFTGGSDEKSKAVLELLGMPFRKK